MQRSLLAILSEKNISTDDPFEIVVFKNDRILSISHNETLLKSYPIVLGGSPEGDKRMEGDKKTPEGNFDVKSKFEHAKWNKFIWVDYPNEDSHHKHEAAKAAGEIPLSATVGGEIGIHGVPEGKDEWIDRGVDWTLGCISLKNDDIDEFYSLVGNHWKIVIQN